MSYIYNLFKIKSGLDINNIIYLGKERKNWIGFLRFRILIEYEVWIIIVFFDSFFKLLFE